MKHTFAWTIERFSERQEPNSQFLWSSKFTIRGPDEQVLQSYLMVFFWEWISEQFLQLASFMKILQLHVTPWKKNFTIAGDSLEDETVSQGWYSRSSWLLVCISFQPGLPVSISAHSGWYPWTCTKFPLPFRPRQKWRQDTSSQFWMSPRTNRIGSNLPSLSSRSAIFINAQQIFVIGNSGEAWFLGLPKVHFHGLPQIPS